MLPKKTEIFLLKRTIGYIVDFFQQIKYRSSEIDEKTALVLGVRMNVGSLLFNASKVLQQTYDYMVHIETDFPFELS